MINVTLCEFHLNLRKIHGFTSVQSQVLVGTPTHVYTHTDFYEIQRVACTWQKYSSPAESPWQKLPRHPLLRRCVHHHHTLPHCGARLTLLQARLNLLLCPFCITCFIFSLHFWPPCSAEGSQQSSLPGLLWSDGTMLLQPYFTSQQAQTCFCYHTSPTSPPNLWLPI